MMNLTKIQLVKLLKMATNTLNQSGHPGAFLNLIHRKADAEDSGLVNLKDMRSKCQYLPLSENRGIL